MYGSADAAAKAASAELRAMSAIMETTSSGACAAGGGSGGGVGADLPAPTLPLRCPLSAMVDWRGHRVGKGEGEAGKILSEILHGA